MLKFTTLTPGTVRPLDGRWTFTMVVDGVEEPAITPACVSASEAKRNMRALVAAKNEINNQG